jgi:hypothetical protein
MTTPKRTRVAPVLAAASLDAIEGDGPLAAILERLVVAQERTADAVELHATHARGLEMTADRLLDVAKRQVSATEELRLALVGLCAAVDEQDQSLRRSALAAERMLYLLPMLSPTSDEVITDEEGVALVRAKLIVGDAHNLREQERMHGLLGR